MSEKVVKIKHPNGTILELEESHADRVMKANPVYKVVKERKKNVDKAEENNSEVT